ncbi:hypothetical protein PVK06_024427 [Gossypium arboreum]|uniref:Peroxin-13 n=1 Tax=Gossypium arboreum TaxID=29729 RepID=A0ABR0PDP2_GOSAR|nr:hypothetical protein PVK06_024427 [Gossypium arboreum]
MAANSQLRATGESPPKPWEQAKGLSDSGTFKPPSVGSTNDVVEASGTARLSEIVLTTDRTTAVNRNVLGKPLPNRPWERQTYGSTCGEEVMVVYENSGMYGGGLGGFGGPMGGYRMRGMGPYGEQD